LGFTAIAVSGCFQPSPPEVVLQSYSISKVTLEGVEINFNFEIKNPNPIPMDVKTYDYRVYINDIEFLNENRSGFSLSASDKKIVIIPVFIRYEKLLGTAASIFNTINSGGQTIDYRIEGSVIGSVVGITISAPIKTSGTIQIPQQ